MLGKHIAIIFTSLFDALLCWLLVLFIEWIFIFVYIKDLHEFVKNMLFYFTVSVIIIVLRVFINKLVKQWSFAGSHTIKVNIIGLISAILILVYFFIPILGFFMALTQDSMCTIRIENPVYYIEKSEYGYMELGFFVFFIGTAGVISSIRTIYHIYKDRKIYAKKIQ